MNQQEIFQKTYQGLNEKQKQAVDTIEGPVMVIAGPGTGKTQILGARIGKILLETDTRPENILCLTYTDAGVVAMRKRLLNFIGPDAYKVNISTFHAFCNDIIQENLSLFEKKELDPVSDLERLEILKKLIDTFPNNHLLKRYRGDAHYEAGNLKSLFSTMKREGWTPSLISRKIDEYLQLIRDSEPGSPYFKDFKYQRKQGDKKPGDLKPAFEELQEKMEKLRAAANEFPRFQDMMRKRNRYDFDDMINWVIEVFENNETLLRRYQEQFLYILVDEFQDTSGTQNKLVRLLIDYWDKPNIFVVGDDDQSIYRFQGANIENMQQFADDYSRDLFKVVLTGNYRSTQPILDVSKSLIDRNSERLVNKMEGLSKELVASHEKRKGPAAYPRILEYDSPAQEMISITLQVEKLLQEGVLPGRIGVIYRENKYGEELIKYFKLKNIPVYSKRSLNILEVPLVRKMILLFQYLNSEHDIPYSGDEMLFEILHFDWFGIPAIEIARLASESADSRFTENKISLRGLLFRKSHEPAKDLFARGIHPGLKKASVFMEALISDVTNLTLQNLTEEIIRKGGVLNHIMKSPERIWLLEVLTAFFDFIKEETQRNPLLTLPELVKTLDMMEEESIRLPLVQVSGTDKAVNLMTVHGSKGLEFEYVFFAGCNAMFWEKKTNPGRNGYRYPDTLFVTQPKQLLIEEMRRLFYVALTRAEKQLNISYSRFQQGGKDAEASMFIAEIQDAWQLPVERISVSAEEQAEFQALQLSADLAPEMERSEAEFIDRILEKFVMNVTALNNYLKCPLEFYFKNLVRIPSPKNEATEFGSAVHYALEQLFRKMQASQEQFPARETFLADFDWYMHRHRESFTKEQFERRLEYGHNVLPPYYDKYVHSWNRIVAIERNIRNVVLNRIPLKGKLDKLEFDGNAVNVVDYKTGDPDKAREKLKGPDDKKPLGGDYWRQAVFYKILVDHYDQRKWQVLSTEFDFIEPDGKKNYRKQKLMISPTDIATVTQQITDTWHKIQRRDFYTGCGKEDCHWCNFVKTNQLAIALHEIQEEETAD
ncbi:MAG TPA: ATP-dependent DNA helicase [Puia sp.]|nr:ATP-dependent DNA helicase [Puia sp.]